MDEKKEQPKPIVIGLQTLVLGSKVPAGPPPKKEAPHG